MNKRALTTYEIAAYCQVTPRAVIQWVNEGKLKAYRTPGNHSRVGMDDFMAFLDFYKIPVPSELSGYIKGGKKKILIVDDDRGVVDSIRRILVREKKYEMEVAFDGFEAGEKFSAFKPDLILLDIQMPGLDGFKVCSRIRSNASNRNVKIVFISANIDESSIAQIRNCGADDYMSKPIDAAGIKAKIRNVLNEEARQVIMV